MFASKNRGTVIAKGLKVVGSVTAEGLVEVNGQIEARCIAPRSSSRVALSFAERSQQSA